MNLWHIFWKEWTRLTSDGEDRECWGSTVFYCGLVMTYDDEDDDDYEEEEEEEGRLTIVKTWAYLH